MMMMMMTMMMMMMMMTMVMTMMMMMMMMIIIMTNHLSHFDKTSKENLMFKNGNQYSVVTLYLCEIHDMSRFVTAMKLFK